MKKIVLVALTILGAGIATSKADVSFSISFGHHGYRPMPVYAPVCPPPVRHCAPVVVAPAPVAYCAPVVVAPPPAHCAPVVVQPSCHGYSGYYPRAGFRVEYREHSGYQGHHRSGYSSYHGYNRSSRYGY